MYGEFIGCVEYDRFEDVEYLAKGGFGNSFNSMNWNEKLDILNWIAHGLNKIHCNGHDFHCDNILNDYNAKLTLLIWDYINQQMKNLKVIIIKYIEYYLM